MKLLNKEIHTIRNLFFLGTFSKFFAVVFITCLLMKRNFYVCLMFNNFTFYSPIRCLYSVQLNDGGRENADKTFQFNIVHQSCIKVHCPVLVLQCCSASNDALKCRVGSGWGERPAPGPGRDQLPPLKYQHLPFQLYASRGIKALRSES